MCACVRAYVRVRVRACTCAELVARLECKRFAVAGLKRRVVADTGYRTVLVDCGFTNSTDVGFSPVNGA